MSIVLATSLLEHLQKPNVIVALILAVFGICFALLAKRTARAFRHKSEIPDDDMIMVIMKIVGLVMILVALILMVVDV